jgi:hypothetical protein
LSILLVTSAALAAPLRGSTQASLALARVWWHEADPEAVGDQYGMFLTLTRRAQASRHAMAYPFPYGLIWLMGRYAPHTLPNARARTPKERWVQTLRSDCLQPAAWPVTAPDWRKYRPACLDLLARARGLIALGSDPSSVPCQASSPIDHWGGPCPYPGAPTCVDDRRAKRFGWVPVTLRCHEGPSYYAVLPGSSTQTHLWCSPDLSDCTKQVGELYPRDTD